MQIFSFREFVSTCKQKFLVSGENILRTQQQMICQFSESLCGCWLNKHKTMKWSLHHTFKYHKTVICLLLWITAWIKHSTSGVFLRINTNKVFLWLISSWYFKLKSLAEINLLVYWTCNSVLSHVLETWGSLGIFVISSWVRKYAK